jgi:hypothetical protein
MTILYNALKQVEKSLANLANQAGAVEQPGENPNHLGSLGYPLASSTTTMMMMRKGSTAAGSVGNNDCSTSTTDGNVRADDHVNSDAEDASRSTLPSTPLSARHSTTATTTAVATTNSKNSWRWSQNHKTAFADYHQNVILGRSLSSMCIYSYRRDLYCQIIGRIC